MSWWGPKYEQSTLRLEPIGPSTAHPACSPNPMFTRKPGILYNNRACTPTDSVVHKMAAPRPSTFAPTVAGLMAGLCLSYRLQLLVAVEQSRKF